MYVLQARNVHQALPQAIRLLRNNAVVRPSRNGEVLQYPTPVATVYSNPEERVIFWPDRDANPFFHLYESFWMLAGRNDLAPLTRYVKRFADFSDDGKTLAGAYGYRWRFAFDPIDQLTEICKMLRADKTNRRAVLQMWDANYDLGANSKDIPCNLTITFQVNHDDRLDMVVFCRSNDIIWGAYGANAVHMAFLLEYMALGTGYPMGTYTQISVNWHAYRNIFDKVKNLPGQAFDSLYQQPFLIPDPYRNLVSAVPMWTGRTYNLAPEHVKAFLDRETTELLYNADHGFHGISSQGLYPFWDQAYKVLLAHEIYRDAGAKDAFQYLDGEADASVDWVRAAMEWLQRRMPKESV